MRTSWRDMVYFLKIFNYSVLLRLSLYLGSIFYFVSVLTSEVENEIKSLCVWRNYLSCLSVFILESLCLVIFSKYFRHASKNVIVYKTRGKRFLFQANTYIFFY